jgi:hypothetical protein
VSQLSAEVVPVSLGRLDADVHRIRIERQVFLTVQVVAIPSIIRQPRWTESAPVQFLYFLKFPTRSDFLRLSHEPGSLDRL